MMAQSTSPRAGAGASGKAPGSTGSGEHITQITLSSGDEDDSSSSGDDALPAPLSRDGQAARRSPAQRGAVAPAPAAARSPRAAAGGAGTAGRSSVSIRPSSDESSEGEGSDDGAGGAVRGVRTATGEPAVCLRSTRFAAMLRARAAAATPASRAPRLAERKPAACGRFPTAAATWRPTLACCCGLICAGPSTAFGGG